VTNSPAAAFRVDEGDVGTIALTVTGPAGQTASASLPYPTP